MNIEVEIKQTTFTSENHKAYPNLIYTANWSMDKSKAITKKHGLTAQQFNVLRILKGRHPNSCSAGEIKKVILHRSSEITRLVDRLLIKGLVTRDECVTNRRRMDISTTKNGIALLEIINPEIKITVNKNNRK